MSKGDKKRPQQVSDSHVKSEWERIFNKPKPSKNKPNSVK